jgi:hypothetical protein
VGCLIYLGVSTCPDITYYAMWLGQFSFKPTCSHMLAAKHVLHYLGGTKLLALSLGVSLPSLPDTLSGFIKSMGCSDANGHQILLIGRVSPDILSIFRVFLSCGRLLNKNLSLSY